MMLNDLIAADFSSPPPSGSQPPTAVSSQNSQQPLTLPVVPSQLSADAAEFVPRSEVSFS